MANVIIGLFMALMIVFSAFCCCVASRRCSREEEKLERFENDDSGNV